MTKRSNQPDRLHIHFELGSSILPDEDRALSRLENAIVTWLNEELHWPQPDADGPCTGLHRVNDAIPGIRFVPALPWCDSLPREDANSKWSRIVAMLPEWSRIHRGFVAFGFITSDDQDDIIEGFVVRHGTISQFAIPRREFRPNQLGTTLSKAVCVESRKYPEGTDLPLGEEL